MIHDHVFSVAAPKVRGTWSIYEIATGLFTGATFSGTEDRLAANIPEGHAAISGVHDHLSRRVDLGTGGVIDFQPDPPASTDYETFTWDTDLRRWVSVRTLAGEKRAVIERLKIARDTRLEGGFEWDGSLFQSDSAISQPRLLGLFTTAIAGGIPSDGYPWRLANNDWRVLDAMDATAVWSAFQEHMSALFAAFAIHEAAVLAETEIEVVKNYDVESGW